MHRSQILLEEWQYQFLRDKARRGEQSISHIVRELVSDWIESQDAETWEGDPFLDIVGLASGDGRAVSLEHDYYLYTTDWYDSSPHR